MKKLVLLSLAVIMIVSIFVPFYAFADNNYDVELNFFLGGEKFVYLSKNNRNNMPTSEANERAVFCSLKLKKQLCDTLVERGFDYKNALEYVFPNIDKIFGKLEKKVNRRAVSASFAVKNGGVSYTPMTVGRRVDFERLYNEIFLGKRDLKIVIADVLPELSDEKARELSSLRAAFSTDFSSSGANRRHNIVRSLAAFDGLKIAVGEIVSFNAVVGERTENNGYKTSKIIVDGEYVDGVGGGVCQVSTTLYNALLRAGVSVKRRSRHSLVSSYVDAGFDAMVNSVGADLVFVNNTDNDIYIATDSKNGTASVKIFGVKPKYAVKTESVELTREPPTVKIIKDVEKKYADRVFYDDESFVLSNGSDKVTAEAYLLFYQGEKLVSRALIHKDVYKEAPKIIVFGTEKRPETDACE